MSKEQRGHITDATTQASDQASATAGDGSHSDEFRAVKPVRDMMFLTIFLMCAKTFERYKEQHSTDLERLDLFDKFCTSIIDPNKLHSVDQARRLCEWIAEVSQRAYDLAEYSGDKGVLQARRYLSELRTHILLTQALYSSVNEECLQAMMKSEDCLFKSIVDVDDVHESVDDVHESVDDVHESVDEVYESSDVPSGQDSSQIFLDTLKGCKKQHSTDQGRCDLFVRFCTSIIDPTKFHSVDQAGALCVWIKEVSKRAYELAECSGDKGMSQACHYLSELPKHMLSVQKLYSSPSEGCLQEMIKSEDCLFKSIKDVDNGVYTLSAVRLVRKQMLINTFREGTKQYSMAGKEFALFDLLCADIVKSIEFYTVGRIEILCKLINRVSQRAYELAECSGDKGVLQARRYLSELPTHVLLTQELYSSVNEECLQAMMKSEDCLFKSIVDVDDVHESVDDVHESVDDVHESVDDVHESVDEVYESSDVPSGQDSSQIFLDTLKGCKKQHSTDQGRCDLFVRFCTSIIDPTKFHSVDQAGALCVWIKEVSKRAYELAECSGDKGMSQACHYLSELPEHMLSVQKLYSSPGEGCLQEMIKSGDCLLKSIKDINHGVYEPQAVTLVRKKMIVNTFRERTKQYSIAGKEVTLFNLLCADIARDIEFYNVDRTEILCKLINRVSKRACEFAKCSGDRGVVQACIYLTDLSQHVSIMKLLHSSVDEECLQNIMESEDCLFKSMGGVDDVYESSDVPPDQNFQGHGVFNLLSDDGIGNASRTIVPHAEASSFTSSRELNAARSGARHEADSSSGELNAARSDATNTTRTHAQASSFTSSRESNAARSDATNTTRTHAQAFSPTSSRELGTGAHSGARHEADSSSGELNATRSGTTNTTRTHAQASSLTSSRELNAARSDATNTTRTIEPHAQASSLTSSRELNATRSDATNTTRTIEPHAQASSPTSSRELGTGAHSGARHKADSSSGELNATRSGTTNTTRTYAQASSLTSSGELNVAGSGATNTTRTHAQASSLMSSRESNAARSGARHEADSSSGELNAAHSGARHEADSSSLEHRGQQKKQREEGVALPTATDVSVNDGFASLNISDQTGRLERNATRRPSTIGQELPREQRGRPTPPTGFERSSSQPASQKTHGARHHTPPR